MNDLNFDELDQAVNSMMNAQVQKATPSSETDDTPNISVRNDEGAAVKPAEASVPSQTSQDASEPKIIVNKFGSRLTTSPVRRGGHGLIDIMAPAEGQSKPQRLVSRFGADIQPLPKTKTAETGAAKEEKSHTLDEAKSKHPRLSTEMAVGGVDVMREPAPEIQERPQEAVEPKTTEKAEQSISPVAYNQYNDELWPDPLEIEDSQQNSEPKEEPATEPEEQGSPFIPGAKVLKRPLGAFAEAVATAEAAPVSAAENVTEPRAVQEEQLKQDEPLLDEPVTDRPDHELPAGDKAEAPVVPDPVSQDVVSEPPVLAIPQQYKTAEQTISSDKSSIFDTKEYHAPLAETTAKAGQPGKLLLRIIIVLVVIAVVVGALYVAYKFLMPNSTFLPY